MEEKYTFALDGAARFRQYSVRCGKPDVACLGLFFFLLFLNVALLTNALYYSFGM